MMKLLLSLFAVLALTSVALADSPTTPTGKSLNWADFKTSCQNPQQFQAQRPPENIKIICKDTRFAWAPVEAGQVRMATTPRTVTSEVYSDKYHVAIEQRTIVAEDSMGTCARFKEVGQTMSTERAVTCDEVLAFTGGLHEFCSGVADQLLAANMGAAQVYDTGRTMDTCGKVETAAPVLSSCGDLARPGDGDYARDCQERQARLDKKHRH